MLTRVMLIRLCITAGTIAGLAAMAFAILILTTSGPSAPASPLPTATARPGPPPAETTRLAVPVATATLPLVPSEKPAADPNTQLQIYNAGSVQATKQPELAYIDASNPHAANPPCGRHGRWLLDVNPYGAISRAYPAYPNGSQWMRAATAANLAIDICPVDMVVSWIGHKTGHPSFGKWTVLLPVSVAWSSNGARLQRYAMQHAQPA